jgi:hypothetical protein
MCERGVSRAVHTGLAWTDDSTDDMAAHTCERGVSGVSS